MTRQMAEVYVLSGDLRLVLADHDLVLGPGEAGDLIPGCPTGSAARASSPSGSSAC